MAALATSVAAVMASSAVALRTDAMVFKAHALLGLSKAALATKYPGLT